MQNWLIEFGNSIRPFLGQKFYENLKWLSTELTNKESPVGSNIFGYIESYYNRISLHSGLSYKSPLEFEKELKIKQRSESFVS